MSDGTIHSPQAVTPPEPGHGYDARSSSGLVATVEQTVDIIGPSGSPGVPPFSSPPATDSGHGRGSGSATEQPRATTSNSRFNSGAMLAPTTSDPASASDSSTTPTASARPTDVWHDAVAPSPSRTPGPDSTIRTDKGKGRAAPLAVVTDQLGVSSGGGAKPAFESPFMSEPLTADSPTSYLATDADGEASDADADSDARHSTLLAGHRGGSTITPHGGHGSNSRARTPTQRRPLAMSHTFASPTFSAASPVSPFSPQLRRRLSDQTHSPTGATRPHIRHSRSYLSHVAGRDSADDDPEAFPAMGSVSTDMALRGAIRARAARPL
jgi:hypothetical protein